MRYKLDASGYISAVSFGCYLDNCTEYTGTVPSGYKTLDGWASNACIQAYYINQRGNLTLDSYRKAELEQIQAQEAIDNAPVLRKDIYETEEVLNSQYMRRTVTGKVIVLDDIKTIAPKVKITEIQPGYGELSIYTQGKNMMPCDAVSSNISGVTFTKNMSGSITALGTATEDIEYTIADGKDTPIFALKDNTYYYLNLGDLQCELRYFDGETTAQQYVGASGLLNVPENIEVTQVVIKIANGDTVNTTFYPQLEYGNSFTSYTEHKRKSQEIYFADLVQEVVIPNDELYAKDTLYPGMSYKDVDYILIENGKIYISINDKVYTLGNGSVGLFGDYSTIYATKDVMLEVEYSDNLLEVGSLAFLQGKSTTTNQFKILKDGSIEAHNGYFSGKIEADSGYFSGTVKGGSISIGNNFSVDEKGNCTANSFKSSNAQITGGSINIQTSSGDTSAIILNGGSYKNSISPAGIALKSGSYTTTLNPSGISVVSTSEHTTITPGSITVNNLYSYPVSSGINMYSPVKFYEPVTLTIGNTHKVEGALECSDNVTFKGTGTFSAENNSIKLGRSTSAVGFFGDYGASKKSVSEIYSTSSATASDVATKLNELIKALKAYNLIG